MYIETDLHRLDSVEKVDESIDRLTDVLSKLRAHREALKAVSKSEREKYVGKIFVQNRYEEGTRFMHVLECRRRNGYLDFFGYGAEYLYQDQQLQFIDSMYPTWFHDVLYGELKETDEEGMKQAIRDSIEFTLENDICG